MKSHFRTRSLSMSFVLFLFIGAACSSGGDSSNSTVDSNSPTSWIVHWNRVAIDASGRDHAPGGGREQLGPVRSIRAIAIAHVAMADAVSAISGSFRSYMPVEPAPAGTSMKAAIAQAGHDALVAMFPSQSSIFEKELSESLAAIEDGVSKSDGIALGRKTAQAILEAREDDGSNLSEPYVPVTYTPKQAPGKWRRDPLNPNQTPVGSTWKRTLPFVIASASQFRLPPPPALGSAEYAQAYNEVKRLGGDGVVTPTERTEDQTIAGIYWAYDGTPSLCAPPRLYNQIAVQIALDEGLDVVELARLLALVNVSMSDAGLASWDSKYHYEYWRPVTGIRESDPGTGPTGQGDGNNATVGDESFVPLGAPLSNLNGPNFTPPFPAYPSGHATFGGALFQTLRNYFGTDNISFTFVSDEFNGATKDNQGNSRPLIPRSFSSLSEAEEENGQSRIYLGIHWSFDKTSGISQGRNVANWVTQNAYQVSSREPLPVR